MFESVPHDALDELSPPPPPPPPPPPETVDVSMPEPPPPPLIPPDRSTGPGSVIWCELATSLQAAARPATRLRTRDDFDMMAPWEWREGRQRTFARCARGS